MTTSINRRCDAKYINTIVLVNFITKRKITKRCFQLIPLDIICASKVKSSNSWSPKADTDVISKCFMFCKPLCVGTLVS